MIEARAEQKDVDASYDSVATLYDSTFEDIIIRRDELNWLDRKLAKIRPQAVLDIGCGNGAFLNRLSGNFQSGTGVDLSNGMLIRARSRFGGNHKLQFKQVYGPSLPFPDNSFDVVTSTLSFRYLDWDPMVAEVLRVLKPGGYFLVVDMVTAPVQWRELGKFFLSKIRFFHQRIRYPQYYRTLRKMVTSGAWKRMLQHNPIRSEHEMRWYLESRFQGCRAEIINIGAKSRVLAFDSGKIFFKSVEKISYP